MAILSCHVSIKLPPKISDGQHFFTLGCSLAPADRSGSLASDCSICPSHSVTFILDGISDRNGFVLSDVTQ